jgi:sulfur carrier protein ThiS
MKVKLRNPDREIDVVGARSVRAVLDEIGVDPDTVLVIRSGELVMGDTRLDEGDELEVRPVISGGASSGEAGP